MVAVAYQSVVCVEKEARLVVFGVDHAGDVLHVDHLVLARPYRDGQADRRTGR